MPKCPYCNSEIHIEDFFNIFTRESKKGKIKGRRFDFKGEFIEASYNQTYKMWSCPSCDKILGFSEYYWARAP